MEMKTFYILKKLEKFSPQMAASIRINGGNPDEPKAMEAYADFGEAMSDMNFFVDTHRTVCEQFNQEPTDKYSVEKIEVDPDTTLSDVRQFEVYGWGW